MSIELPKAIAEHVNAVNALDVAAVMATFTDDAFVNDDRREYWGAEQIRAWVEQVIVGARVQMEPVELMNHHQMMILRARYDGDFDRTSLPPELILTNYISLRGDEIESLIVVFNQAQPAKTA